jgi:regulatory protein YycI of two-component signal transduction system YycFG
MAGPVRLINAAVFTIIGSNADQDKSGRTDEMERSRLKNIIIFILALVNICLLASLSIRRIQEHVVWSQTTSELSSMFQADGITLDPDQIPSTLPPGSLELNRDTDVDSKLAAFILGEDLTLHDVGGGILTCTSSLGTASFRAGGSFFMSGHLGTKNLDELCRKFCSTFGYEDYHYDAADGNGLATAIQVYNGYQIINCQITFLIQNGNLISVSGTHVPGNSAGQDNRDSMTAATALVRFLEARRESGIVATSIRKIQACYKLQSTTAAPLMLAPIWRISTDSGNYDVSCLNGSVSRA